MDNNKLLTYDELKDSIEGQNNNLLIANGFNNGLGVDTSYEKIFNKMIECNHGDIYNDALEIIKGCNYDLEAFILSMTETIDDGNEFLKKYVSNKIKLDFMMATQQIVKESVKNIYAEKNDGVYLLLKHFTNYFTLNYDSFLYLLLLKFKKPEEVLSDERTIVLGASLNYIEDDLNKHNNFMFEEIKNLRNNGKTSVGPSGEEVVEDLSHLTRSDFQNQVGLYSKKSGREWKVQDIKKVIDKIWEEEKQNVVLDIVDDGFKNLEFQNTLDKNNKTLQNVFFLHGAFHLYEDGKIVRKINATSDKALYDKLEEVLCDNDKKICTVFQPNDKLDAIGKSTYLKKCIESLRDLSGNIVIIGSSLDKNDDHIFLSINNSNIQNVYVSVYKNFEEIYSRANEVFTNKKIYYFDATTISYHNSN